MHSLTQKMTIAVSLFLLASAHADNTAAVPDPLKLSAATMQFVQVYAAYAKAVRDHGVDGLKTFITPDFTLGSENPPLASKAALKELGGIAFPDAHLSAAVHPLSITATDAVVLSEETYTVPVKPHTQDASLSYTSWSFSYDWKQAWRKTPQGWKLASMKRYRGDFADVEGVTFTVLPDAKSDPAKAQEKQDVLR